MTRRTMPSAWRTSRAVMTPSTTVTIGRGMGGVPSNSDLIQIVPQPENAISPTPRTASRRWASRPSRSNGSTSSIIAAKRARKASHWYGPGRANQAEIPTPKETLSQGPRSVPRVSSHAFACASMLDKCKGLAQCRDSPTSPQSGPVSGAPAAGLPRSSAQVDVGAAGKPAMRRNWKECAVDGKRD